MSSALPDKSASGGDWRGLTDALDQVVWYARCLEDLQDGRPVRGLGEAKAGYVAGLDVLRDHVANVAQVEGVNA